MSSSVNTSSSWESLCSTRIENCLAPRPSRCLLHLLLKDMAGAVDPLDALRDLHTLRSLGPLLQVDVPRQHQYRARTMKLARLPDALASSYCSLSWCKLGDALWSFFISATFDNWSGRWGDLVAPGRPLHGLGCWSPHCCVRFRGLRKIDCYGTLFLIFCLLLGTSWTRWNVKL